MIGIPKSSRWAVGLTTFVVWALVAGSAVYWALQWSGMGRSTSIPVVDRVDGEVSIDSDLLDRALGAARMVDTVSPTPDLAAQLKLNGVLAHGSSGAILISVGDQAAKVLRVGGELQDVPGNWRLQSVSTHRAILTADGHQIKLDMPPLDERSQSGDMVARRRVPKPETSPQVRLPRSMPADDSADRSQPGQDPVRRVVSPPPARTSR